MLLDDLVQLCGHAGGLPGLRLGMTTNEARAVVGGSMLCGDLRFTVGDPVRTTPPAAFHGVVRAWREIELSAQARWDDDGSFWSGASIVADYLASELGAPAPRIQVGRRGQKLIRLRIRGTADGVPVEARLAADGLTEDGVSMELSILPDRPWSDLIGDALGVGAALSSLLAPEGNTIPSGGTRALPSDLDGSHVEVLHAVDGALRLRISEGRPAGSERPQTPSALTNVEALLRRRSAAPLDVQLTMQPAKGWAAELVIQRTRSPI